MTNLRLPLLTLVLAAGLRVRRSPAAALAGRLQHSGQQAWRRPRRHHAPHGADVDQREPRSRPGKRLSLAFDVTPKKLMHVYAPGKHDYQVIGVKLDPQPWLRVQPTTYPPSEIYHFKELDEKVETYGKPFKLVQDVTDSRDARGAEAAGGVADRQDFRPPRIPGLRRQGLLRADPRAGELYADGEVASPAARRATDDLKSTLAFRPGVGIIPASWVLVPAERRSSSWPWSCSPGRWRRGSRSVAGTRRRPAACRRASRTILRARPKHCLY